MTASLGAGGWLVPPQKYDQKTSMLNIGRGYIRYALRSQKILVFSLIKDKTTRTGFRLNYRLACEEPYLAISHSWTDRTGHGNSITLHDLAPWPITLSPAKIHLLDWLYGIQSQGQPWTSWYWMDLFCIDQTRDDEHVFSQQLEQIPSIFFRAKSCLALLASWPCQEAIQYWKGVQLITETKEDEHWDSVVNWLYGHARQCSCSPTLDAWLTRVWTRQEVLYSKDLTMVPATVWLGGSSEASNPQWRDKPNFYIAPPGDGGVRELASTLVTWQAKYEDSHTSMSASRIAKAIRLLLCGETVRFSLPAEVIGASSQHEPSIRWHAFNWAMIVDGSTRCTSHTRDAILSQMLLLPGYRVPPEPWSMPLQELIADSCFQYRQLLRQWQIVPMITGTETQHGGRNILSIKAPYSFEGAALCEILLSVGSPCVLPASFYALSPQQNHFTQSLLTAYRNADTYQYRVISFLNLESHPLELAEFALSLQQVWSDAESCRTAWNIRACLKDIKVHSTKSLDASGNHSLKRALRHFIGRLIHTSPFMLSDLNRRSDSKIQYSDSELHRIEVPNLLGLELTHNAPELPNHTTLAFGNLLPGEQGTVWGLGQDKTTKLELGVIAEECEDNTLRVRASGLLLMTAGRRTDGGLRTAADVKLGFVLP
jgi:hypothetical protein